MVKENRAVRIPVQRLACCMNQTLGNDGRCSEAALQCTIPTLANQGGPLPELGTERSTAYRAAKGDISLLKW